MEFFNVVSRQKFLELAAGFSPVAKVETIALGRATGRILARDILSREDIPVANRSAMDGYAVRAADLFGASESNPGYLDTTGEISIEVIPNFVVKPGQCAKIPTGGFLPRGTDSVAMVEYTKAMDSGTVEFHKAVAPHENVLLKGEDVAMGETALAAGTLIRPQEVGLLAALGVSEVPVLAMPKAGVMSTGDELVPVYETPPLGSIRDVNSHTVCSILETAGAVPANYGIAPDDLVELKESIAMALDQSDVVLLSGGSSVGSRDLTLEALSCFSGFEVLAHGVSMRPGKPTILARVGEKPVIGLPGQVASAQVVMLALVVPAIRHLAGDTQAFDRARPGLTAEISRNLASVQGREDFIRVRLESRGNNIPLAHPVLAKSGLLKSLVTGQGLVAIPANSEGVYKGETVGVWLI